METIFPEHATPPSQLSTPSLIEQQAIIEISNSLATLTADAIALYVKTKNYHWHVTGMHFRDLHLLFDEQAGDLIAMVDVLAERARKIGGTAIRSIAEISRLTRVPNDDDAFVPPKEMIERLKNDNLQLAKNLREAKSVCDRASDDATAAILDELIDQTERRVWFLDASLK